MLQPKLVKPLIAIAVLLVSAYLGWEQLPEMQPAPGTAPPAAQHNDARRSSLTKGAESIAAAFATRANNVDIIGTGVVTRILADDTDGSRHQRFVLDVQTDNTVLIAHNIDLAPRIDNLQLGDRVDFKGVYEWNARGGVIHWTHHDPQRRRTGGWLKHNGRTYE